MTMEKIKKKKGTEKVRRTFREKGHVLTKTKTTEKMFILKWGKETLRKKKKGKTERERERGGGERERESKRLRTREKKEKLVKHK